MTFAGYACNMMDLSPQYSGAVSAVAVTGIVGGVFNTLFASFIVGLGSDLAHWRMVFWLEASAAAIVGVFYFLFAAGERQPWADGLKNETQPLLGFGIFLTMCFRVSFVLVLTHTTRRSNVSSPNDVSIYPNCTTFNSSDRDYVSDFSEETGIQFHSVYFVGSLLGMIASGVMTNRLPSHCIMGLGITSSSVLFLLLPTVFQISSSGVFVLRFLQGVFEGLIHPAVAVFVSSWSLKHEKSTLLAVSCLGIQLGPALSNIFVGACLCYISWHSGIYILGSLGIVWTLIWFPLATSTLEENRYVGNEELKLFSLHGEELEKVSKSVAVNTPWRAILTSKHVWVIWLGNFCKNVVNTTIMTLQPQFFKDVFNLKVADIGLLLSVPFFLGSFFVFIFCFLTDQIIKHQLVSVTFVRKLMQCVGVTVEAVFFICMAYSSTWHASFVFLTLAYSLGQMSFAGYACNSMDLSPQYSGAVSAVAVTGIVGGVFNTLFASFIVGLGSDLAHWRMVFWLEAAVAAIVGVFYFLFASGERQPWADGLKNETERNIHLAGFNENSETPLLLNQKEF
ncbi:hypothetical protein Btru_053784 [Bulinus truncatus]|nr:hypothetical protein Btru_053784 [Bulinus truncatus]